MRKDNIFRVEDLPVDANIHFKKDFLGWTIVHPIRDDDGKLNLTNLIFGGKRNALMTLILCLVLLGLIFAYSQDVNRINEHYESISKDPLLFCKNVAAGNYTSSDNINISLVKEHLS